MSVNQVKINPRIIIPVSKSGIASAPRPIISQPLDIPQPRRKTRLLPAVCLIIYTLAIFGIAGQWDYEETQPSNKGVISYDR